MAHAIWKGDINFGLIYIPISLYSAENHQEDIKFSLIDKRNFSPIGYQKINKKTGEKVPPKCIVEGFEYEKEHYVLLTKEEKQKIQLESAQSIKIIEFVPIDSIAPELFVKPYYLEPIGKAKEIYALFREALRESHKAGIAKIIIHTKEYLGAVMVSGNALVLEILRFAYELNDQNKFDLPEKIKLDNKQIKMAEKLINAMSHKWNPKKYKNDFREKLLKVVHEKIEKGKAYELPKEMMEQKERATPSKVADLMSLLKDSIEKANPKTKRTRAGHAKRKLQ